jgi:hypothetical protein
MSRGTGPNSGNANSDQYWHLCDHQPVDQESLNSNLPLVRQLREHFMEVSRQRRISSQEAFGYRDSLNPRLGVTA